MKKRFFEEQIAFALRQPRRVLRFRRLFGKRAFWRNDYNTFLPHSSLNDLTPREFAERSAKADGNHNRIFLSATGTENGCGSLCFASLFSYETISQQ